MLFHFSTLRLLCQNSMRRVLSPTFKQHGPCVETTSRQDNTHYVLQQHTGVLNLHPVMCIGVLYCPRCVEITHEMRYKCCFNTHSSKQHTMVTLMWVISTRLFLFLWIYPHDWSSYFYTLPMVSNELHWCLLSLLVKIHFKLSIILL